MFEDIKIALEAAEQIIGAMSCEKSRCDGSIVYWTNEVGAAIERGDEESQVQWYRTQLAKEEREMEYIAKIENLLYNEVRNVKK